MPIRSCPASPPDFKPGKDIILNGRVARNFLDDLAQKDFHYSEDCLHLNIWAKSATKKAPVLLWLHGGGFSSGGTESKLYNGQDLAASHDVIVVTINYRLNVFGFPGIAGRNDIAQNAGLLDQRLALEWVRDNIAQFGGDPTRITVFGASAGGASVDYHSYAFVDDPIAAGFIAQSGVSTSWSNPAPLNNLKFFDKLSKQLECPSAQTSLDLAIQCLRTKPFDKIANLQASDNDLEAVIGNFGPSVDNKLVFADYPRRARAGQFAKRPFIGGNNNYEAGIFKISASGNPNVSIPGPVWNLFDLAVFTCPTADAVAARTSAGVPAWRYRYYGDFENLRLSTSPDSGTYHYAEVAMLFNTSEAVTGVADTPAQKKVGERMRDMWVAFARDPATGWSAFNLPRYSDSLIPGNTLIQIAYNNDATPQVGSASLTDAICLEVKAGLFVIPGGIRTAIGGSANGGIGGLILSFVGLS